MYNKINILALVAIVFSQVSFAAPATHRIQQFSNQRVTVWETIIYPGTKSNQLQLHRHDNDRVVVALTDGVLKVTNDKGESHLLTLVKEHAYFLPADAPGVLHTDENTGKQPIKVMVVGLN